MMERNESGRAVTWLSVALNIALGASKVVVISAILVGLPAAGNGVIQTLPAAIQGFASMLDMIPAPTSITIITTE